MINLILTEAQAKLLLSTLSDTNDKWAGYEGWKSDALQALNDEIERQLKAQTNSAR